MICPEIKIGFKASAERNIYHPTIDSGDRTSQSPVSHQSVTSQVRTHSGVTDDRSMPCQIADLTLFKNPVSIACVPSEVTSEFLPLDRRQLTKDISKSTQHSPKSQ
jgi:hypothetical protein